MNRDAGRPDRTRRRRRAGVDAVDRSPRRLGPFVVRRMGLAGDYAAALTGGIAQSLWARRGWGTRRRALDRDELGTGDPIVQAA